ncbi:cell envelope biogenesis protein OmpA [Actibacterium mucosum KCTC 23349]|uniref:Cell envelope biogenesis protein OmpA n=1 Tax=Actibacterium mucosum KCTC 23349 TaxID=1454373 RepID=A0A037ZHQ0_9RHOB|nr:cell envelope biogenesis protein OmpA [Actibacterium mucosum KCTC 23349]
MYVRGKTVLKNLFPNPRQLVGVFLSAAVAASLVATASVAQQRKERYVPGIWVDPDGCEHWVMDDGWEGFMTPHVNRDGIPVCRRGNTCGVMPSDQLFATDKSHINAAGRQRLASFFQSSSARAFVITGHTDARASDEYNMGLSLRRANAVAAVGQSVGANIVDVRGYGERQPVATNRTAAGMQKNRRVEIICIR